MPHLHGKGGLQQVCRTCKEECVTWEGIFCDECGNWFHVKCEQVEIQILQAFKDVPEVPYICRSCKTDEKGTFNYFSSLGRMHKAAKHGVEQLYVAVERERLLMKENLTYSTTKAPKYSLDQVSQQLLNKYFPLEKRRAVRITADNNSLFSAVSVALCGSEKLATELRVRCSIEMVVFEAFYRWQKNYTQLCACAPDYPESCINCATPDEDSCVWTLSALASVTRRPVRSLYPAINGKADQAVEALNTVFQPRNKMDEGEELKILWSSRQESDLMQAGAWIPDIFVPLMEVQAVQLIPAVSPTRISGRMRKPTPKIMAITSKDRDKLKVVVHDVDSEGGGDDSDCDPNFDAPRELNQEESDDDFFPQPKVKMENVDFTWMDKYTHAAIGGKPLKGTNFLPAQEIFNELTTASEVLPSIPTGRKEDVYFIVDNSRNLKFRHRRNYFQDDCGRYNQKSGTTCKSYYLLTPDHRLVPLMRNKDKYCRESKRVSLSGGGTPRGRGRRGRPRLDANREDRVTQWIPMEPQPDEDKIIMLNRYYSALEVDPTYRRRISWFVNLPKTIEKGRNAFLVEYLTKAPPGIQLPPSRKVVTNIILADMDEESRDQEDGSQDDLTEKDSQEQATEGEAAGESENSTDTSRNFPDSGRDLNMEALDEGSLPAGKIVSKTETSKNCSQEEVSLIDKEKTSFDERSLNKSKRSDKSEASVVNTIITTDVDSEVENIEKVSERTRKRTLSSETESDTGRGKRKKIPSAKALESSSQTNFDSDED